MHSKVNLTVLILQMGKLRPREAELLVQEYSDSMTVVPWYLWRIGSRTNEKTGAQGG